jgi:hypothetical protein
MGSAVTEPRLVLHDQEVHATVLTPRRREEDCDPRPSVSSLLFAVGAFEFVEIEIEADVLHVALLSRVVALEPRPPPNLSESYSQCWSLSVR